MIKLLIIALQVLAVVLISLQILLLILGWQDYWEQRVWERRKLQITLRKQKDKT